MQRYARGFTLIELSIVLVIIGLIVGGVLVGRDLIRSAELRSVIADIERFNTAANTFIGKYNCVPGDCANATTFFGTWASCSGGLGIPPGQGTCNGNGDGKVVWSTTGAGVFGAYDETTLFWQQLSLAGLITSSYSGELDSPAGAVIYGVDVPSSKLTNGCYAVGYSSMDIQDWPSPPLNAQFFGLGNSHAYNGTALVYPEVTCGGGLYSLPAADALKIDQKIDDGKPYSGIVVSASYLMGGNWNWSGNLAPGCMDTNGGASASSRYDVNARGTACQLFFKTQF